MRKILLGTTALVAVGLLATGTAYAAEDEMMEEEMAPASPVSVAVGGYYNAAIGTVGGAAGDSAHSPSLAQDIEIIVSGSTTLDNGMTVGVSANIEGNRQGVGEDVDDIGGLDERKIFFEGPFGSLTLGSIESARQQTIQWAPGAAGVFGVNSPFFLFTPGFESYATTYDDGLGAEDSAKLVYFTPSFNGFRLGVSYAPSDTEQGQYGGNAMGDEGFSDHTAVSAQYSTDFGGMSLSASVGWETYEAEGMCDSNAVSTAAVDAVDEVPDSEEPGTATYTLDQKMDRLIAMFGGSNNTIDGAYDRSDDATTVTETERAVDAAMAAWGGDPTMNPLLTYGGTGGAVDGLITITTTAADATYEHAEHEFLTGELVTVPGSAAVDAVDAMSPNCEPTALNAGLVISTGGISVGGGILKKDVANDRESTTYDVGISYGEGAYALGLQMAHSETDAIGGGADEMDRYAVNASYVLGPGVSIQAQADSGESTAAGMPGVDWTQIMLGTSISF